MSLLSHLPLFPHQSTTRLRPRRLTGRSTTRSSLPFAPEGADYYAQLEAAVDVVERACRLCVDVKKYLLTGDNRPLEKNDNSPVTVADFGVQALISLELGRLFPSIPLVAEEDSTFLRSSFESERFGSGESLVNSVVHAVTEKVNEVYSEGLSSTHIFEAIDRGVKNDFDKDSTYWILDPIDGTRGFLRDDNALYVVGLALVVQGNVVIGVMGCPNWKHHPDSEGLGVFENKGLIMISHVGCGTWTRKYPLPVDGIVKLQVDWLKCSVDLCGLVHNATFCISDSQTWDSLPLSRTFGASIATRRYRDAMDVLLQPACCGSLCKYMIVASGRASVFILQAKSDKSVKVWDHAVGVLCVHEAGGQVTDWKGNKLDLAADQVRKRIIFPSGGVLVTNRALHTQVLDLISPTSESG